MGPTSSASPAQIASFFTSLRSFSLKHETVTLVYQGNHYEVTTFRGVNQTLEEDLKHRDFTINAMAYDTKRSVVIDPWGGKDDIRKKVVRAVVSPEDRFREDPLRLLRAVRFATELGFRIEGKTLKAIFSMAKAVTTAARERVRDELIRILLCKRPSQGLDIMKKTGLLESILPEIAEGAARKVDPGQAMSVYQHVLAVVDRVAPAEVLRVAALFHGLGEPRPTDHAPMSSKTAREIMARLCFSKNTMRQVVKLAREQEALADYHSSSSDGDLRRFVRRVRGGGVLARADGRQCPGSPPAGGAGEPACRSPRVSCRERIRPLGRSSDRPKADVQERSVHGGLRRGRDQEVGTAHSCPRSALQRPRRVSVQHPWSGSAGPGGEINDEVRQPRESAEDIALASEYHLDHHRSSRRHTAQCEHRLCSH